MKVKWPWFQNHTQSLPSARSSCPIIHSTRLAVYLKVLFCLTYEYSNNEMGANKKEGQVKLERSPVKEASVFKKEEKLPC